MKRGHVSSGRLDEAIDLHVLRPEVPRYTERDRLHVGASRVFLPLWRL